MKKLLGLSMALLLIFMAGCASQSDPSAAAADLGGGGEDDGQGVIADFFSRESGPLLLALEETRTGRISAYRLTDTDGERVSHLLSSAAWEPSEGELPEAPYILSVINGQGETLEIPSRGGAARCRDGSGQKHLTFTDGDEPLFFSLRFLFDGYKANPKNVSVSDTQEDIPTAWISAYAEYLGNTIPGQGNEMSDIRIISLSSRERGEDALQVDFELAVKPVYEAGRSWAAGPGYDGEGELAGYIVAPRSIILEKQEGRWYCAEVLGS